MKLLLIANDDRLKKELSVFFKPKGYAIIHYKNPLKGMNNFKEIEPEIVIFNSTDYPRHWKIANYFLKTDVAVIKPLFFLLINENFPMEEVCKGVYLGVDAVLSNQFGTEGYLEHLESLIGRFYSSQIKMKTPLLFENPEERIDFMFMNPDSFQLATGSLSELSLNGAGFKPDDPKAVFSLQKGTVLEGCSLRADEKIITIKVEILNNSGIMDLSFQSFSDNGKEVLENYINNKETI